MRKTGPLGSSLIIFETKSDKKSKMEDFKMIKYEWQWDNAGQEIRAMRKALNKTQGWLGEKINRTAAHICRIEKGKTIVHSQELQEIRSVFLTEIKRQKKELIVPNHNIIVLKYYINLIDICFPNTKWQKEAYGYAASILL